MAEENLGELFTVEEYFTDPARIPSTDTARWFIIHRIRQLVGRNEFPASITPQEVNGFLSYLPQEFSFALMVDLVDQWARLGASETMLHSLKEVTGL
jgi:hypothetical protein